MQLGERGGKPRAANENGVVTGPNPTIKRLVTSLVIATGFVLVFVGVSSAVTGRDAENLPTEIEDISPVRDATQVLSQEKVVVDLIDGYTGVLTVNNIELETFSLDELPVPEPGQQQTLPLSTIFEPGNHTLTFAPTKGAPVEKWSTGVNTVTVRYWKIIDGPNFAESFTWQFDVV